MSWQPLNETYFVKPEEIKVSSLILDQFKDNHVELRTGFVHYAGTGTLLDSGVRVPLQASVGDKILFGAKVGHKITVDGQDYLLIAEANVLAVDKDANEQAGR